MDISCTSTRDCQNKFWLFWGFPRYELFTIHDAKWSQIDHLWRDVVCVKCVRIYDIVSIFASLLHWKLCRHHEKNCSDMSTGKMMPTTALVKLAEVKLGGKCSIGIIFLQVYIQLQPNLICRLYNMWTSYWLRVCGLV